MKHWSAFATIAGFVVLASQPVQAQTTATGRAFGTTLDLAGTSLLPNPNPSDTQTQSAPPDFDVSTTEAVIDADPLAKVVAEPNRTRSCVDADGCAGAPANAASQYVLSEAHTDTVEVLVDQVPTNNDLIDVDNATSSAQVFCDANGALSDAGAAHIDLLVIAGNPVPIPGDLNPNTTIIAPQLPLIVLNEQIRTSSADGKSKSLSVNAVHAQILPVPAVPAPLGGLIDLKVAGSQASLTNSTCPAGGGGNECTPNLTNSVKTSQILQADRTTPKTQQIPAVGDPIRFTIAATNSAVLDETCPAGSQTGHHLRVIDRIPLGITVDTLSITIQVDDGPATPTTGTIAACDGDLEFTGCPGEDSTDSTRQCLTVTDDDLAPGQTKRISFIGTVNSNATGGNNPGCDQGGTGAGICNTALIQIDEVQNPSGTPRTSGILCPIPAGIGGGAFDPLRTFGGGGCSLRSGSAGRGSEALPVLALGAWLLIRGWRKRSAN